MKHARRLFVALVAVLFALAVPTLALAAPQAGYGNALGLTQAGQSWLEPPLTAYTAFSGTSDFTVEAWFKLDGARTWNTTIFRQESWLDWWQGRLVWWLIVNDQGQLGGGLNDCYHWQWFPASTVTVEDGVWNHVAVVKSGSSVRVFLNGQLAIDCTADDGVMSAIPANMPIYFGGDRLQGNYLEGQMDEIRVWNAALMPATLDDWAYRGVDASHPNAASLVAYYRSDETSGIYATDSSGVNGTARFTTGNPWSQWDGTGSFVPSTIGLSRATYKNTALMTRLAYSASGDSGLNVTITTPPAHGSVRITDARTGRYTYTPDADYEGPDAFSYAVSDGNGTSDPATVDIQVGGEATPTVVAYTGPLTDEDGDGASTLTALLTKADGSPISGHIVEFWVDGAYCGSGVTDADGAAHLACALAQDGVYEIVVTFPGADMLASASSSPALLTVSSPAGAEAAATRGGGWYRPSVSSDSRAHFGFDVKRTLNKRSKNYVLSGHFVWVHEHYGRISATSFTRLTSVSLGGFAKGVRVEGTGRLRTWSAETRTWGPARSVSFVFVAADGGAPGGKKRPTNKPDAFALDIVDEVVDGETNLASPILLSGGSIKIR